ncbi:hypothetical protein T484DRAFT_1760161, partial [Baffinella frigidus]
MRKREAEMRKREAVSTISGAETTAAVYSTKLPDDPELQTRTGAICVVDLVGYKKNADGTKGDKLPDLAIGENVEVVMESGKFFEGFVESIVGLKAGDEAAVPVTFPSNHKVPELRGQATCWLVAHSPRHTVVPELRGLEAIFDVSIKALKDSMFPALTEDFAKGISDSEGLDDLKKKIREGISQ